MYDSICICSLDAGRSSLEVAELDGSYRKVLIWTALDKPRGLVLSHSTGVLYWADWGKQVFDN